METGWWVTDRWIRATWQPANPRFGIDSRYIPAMRVVAVLALDGVVPFDLATPCEVFGRTRLRDGSPGYEVRVCGYRTVVSSVGFELHPAWPLEALAAADTIVIPGVDPLPSGLPAQVAAPLCEAAGRGATIASICTGAFLLAATGLLDGRRATTHWMAAAELARRHPGIRVDPEVLFVDHGRLLTSAGAAAGLDLCLHMVRRDYGAAVAADVARISVMPLEREGGQTQFIPRAGPGLDGATLQPLMAWIEDHIQEEISVTAMARRAATSRRSLTRRFREQTGTTPMRWLHRVRLIRAQELLETTGLSVEEVATITGFASSSTFRERFRARFGISPQGYRRAFRRS